MSGITTTYNDSALWESNLAFDNTRAVGTEFEGMNTGSSSSRIALRQLVPVPEGGFTAHVKSGYSTAFTFFDEDKLYLGNVTGGYSPQGVWLSSSERAVTPVDAAKWMCIYLRTNSSATLAPETIETAEFSIEWEGVYDA